MKQMPFYEEFLNHIVLPKMEHIITSFPGDISSLARLRNKFNEFYGLNISYEQFRQWMKDGGVSLKHTAEVVIAGRAAPPPAAAPPPSGEFPHVAPPEGGAVEYQPARHHRQPSGGATVPSRGRLGIDINQLFE